MAQYPSIRIEGGLFGPDLLEEMRNGERPGQKPADFTVRRGPAPARPRKTRGRRDRVGEVGPPWGARPRRTRSLVDDVARAFADARSYWSVFQHRRERLTEDDVGTSITRASWVEPFLGLLDYELAFNRRAYDLGGLTFEISHRAGTPEDAPPVHVVGVGQELGRAPASGRPRLAPHALLQEYLNRTEALWGVVTNGATLRLLRESTYIRRQAYVEFDLSEMLDEQRFEDFEALYRLLHRSRLPETAGDAADSLIEQYYAHGVEQGGRVRERLRDGVEQCIERLANGFLRHRANARLREQVADADFGAGATGDDLYRQLLVLVYRLLFLLVAEDRGLISTSPLYRGHYGVGRLRDRLDRPASDVDHHDLWQGLRVVWRVLAADSREDAAGGRPLAALLGLPVLNGDLFAPGLFDDAAIANRDLLAAFDHLARYEESGGTRRRVNYAALDVEELGSVYESLLDRRPRIDADAAGQPIFELAAGSQRKSTGSYYTPPTLVAELVKSALTPVLDERLSRAATREERERAVLSMRVCDPACGSGHFLLAAARRLGKELARIRTGEDEPAPERVREAIRDVAAHSIYGVDRNPLAVDLCRVALWIESHDPEKPLTFLDHRIRCGDSLIGVFDLDVLTDGIPDAAFTPLTDDDKSVARLLKKRNKAEREHGQQRLPWDAAASVTGFAEAALRIEAIADDSPEAIRRKRALFEQRHDDPARLRQYLACHLWTAAFFQPLRPGESAITTATLADHLSGSAFDPSALDTAAGLADEHRFFHWPLEFPEVFAARGGAASAGFDVVLGNPPWERVKLQEKEFFAGRHAPIATASNAAARKRMIQTLASSDPTLHDTYRSALREADGRSCFLHDSGRYPLCGRGDINLSAVFAEVIRCLANGRGRAGCVLPTGVATDDTTKLFFQDLVDTRELISLFDFENRKRLFAEVDSRMKFCLFTAGHGGRVVAEPASFIFFAHDAKDLKDPDRAFTLSSHDIELLNPNSRTCPVFRSQRDAELTKALHRRAPALAQDLQRNATQRNATQRNATQRNATQRNATQRLTRQFVGSSVRDHVPHVERLPPVPHASATRSGWLAVGSTSPRAHRPHSWAVSLSRMMDMSNDSHLLRTRGRLEAGGWRLTGSVFRKADAEWFVPLHEGRLGHQFNHRYATQPLGDLREFSPAELSDSATFVEPQYWVNREEAERRLARWPAKCRTALLGYRRVTGSTNERTSVAAILPWGAASYGWILSLGPDAADLLLLCGMYNSFVFDYGLRGKLSQASVPQGTFQQCPALPPDVFARGCPWGGSRSHGEWIRPVVLELTYTAWDLQPFAQDCGWGGPPFRWDEARRFLLRAELDAAFFHLYLPATREGAWRPARTADGGRADETAEELGALQGHFPAPRDAVDYILDTFPIVRRKDEERHGEYRTKRVILEIYDAMQQAAASGAPYVTRLDPPPADARCCHPPREGAS